MQKKRKINPILEEWKQRYSKQPDYIKKQLDDLYHKNSMTNELIPIKRSNKKPVVGDIFIVQPREGLYFYGKVINADIKQITERKQFEGGLVVVLFKQLTKEPILPIEPFDYNELLVQPSIVIKDGWTRGYFYTIGNIPLNKEELKLNYGFFDTVRYVYRKESGEELKKRPKLLGTYAIGSYGAIAYDIANELIINPQLLEK